MTAYEYHATYCRCGGASNRDVDAVLAMEMVADAGEEDIPPMEIVNGESADV